MPMPENSCERKRMKRLAAVLHVMHSDDCALALRSGVYLQPPDPSDLSMSKRTWERTVQAWRSQLRASAHGSLQ